MPVSGGVMGESMIDFATASFQTVDEGLARCEALIRKWQGRLYHSPLPFVYTCPIYLFPSHSPTIQTTGRPVRYSSSDSCRRNPARSRRHHSPNRHATCRVPPFDRALDRNVIAAHCVWLNPKEIELLARTGTSIGHCPKKQSKISQWRCRYRHLPESRNYCRFWEQTERRATTPSI